MKRRRGRKGKSKKPRLMSNNDVASNVVSSNVEENSGVDEFENDEVDSGAEAETPSSTGTDQPEKLASVSSGGPVDSTAPKAVYSRVKVKIKSSKTLDSQPTSSDAHTQSDTDKSSLQVGLEKQGVSEKMEDSANSLSENNLSNSDNPLKKFGGIRIKSSKGLSSATISPCTNTDLVKGESKHEKDLADKNSRYNKQELDVALEVIKKVMKIKEAEPFNVPVNPIALGIPDYFDVIDTPMDFGTICCNLEKGVKYMNSEDVLKDVQYIWGNCYKYNNKGDYIMELMKRVKKNFTKLWIAAGLYCDLPQGVESNQMKDVTVSGNGVMPDNGGPASQMTKKRHGLKKHKDGCLCAICVMMRRRQEREEIARLMEEQTEVSDDYLDEETKPQGISPFQSPGGGYNSSNMDYSPEIDTNSNPGEKRREIKWEDAGNQHTSLLEKRQENDGAMLSQRRGEDETSEHSQLGHRPGEERRDETDEMAAIKLQKPKVVLDKRQKAKMYENLRYLENPMLLGLCGTLFGDGQKSVWNGPHSLARQQNSARRSSIHAAISTLMK